MGELIAPPDIEAGVVNLLDSALAADVSTEVPNPRPSEHIRVTATGGTIRNLVQLDTRVLVECWAPDETTALNLARTAWAHLFAAQNTFLAAGVYATRIDSAGPVNFPDPDVGPRYQFISTITASLTEVSA